MRRILPWRRRWAVFSGLLLILVFSLSYSGSVQEQFRQPRLIHHVAAKTVHLPAKSAAHPIVVTSPIKAPVQPPAAVTISSLVHSNVITTEFSAGEPADKDNGYISNSPSAWLDNWKSAFGGFDDPNSRNGYYPAAFTPKENPFYFALPYDDLTDNGARKSTAQGCLTASGLAATNYSWCKNTWIRVTSGGKTVYAQWEDVGPFEEDDTAYVFGSTAPKNKDGEHAGLDVSPAVTTYLGLHGLDKTTWQFVPTAAVPDGPWKQLVTTSKGYQVN